MEASTAHIAFSASDRVAVRDFYTAALNAGGKPNGSPATRGEDDCLFNAAVLDLDGNSIEVIHREVADDAKSHFSGHSRVLAWTKGIDGPGSINGAATVLSAPKIQPKFLSSASSVISSITKASKAPTTTRSVSTPVLPTQSSISESSSGITTKGLIGTLLGAAAGAAVAYAMVQSERDSARQEAEFEAEMHSRASVSSQKNSTNNRTSPKPTHRNFSTTESVVPQSHVHRNFSVTESSYSVPHKTKTQLALQRAPEPQTLEEVDAGTYRSPTYVSLAPSRGPPRSAVTKHAVEPAPISEAPSSEAPKQGIVYATISYSRRPAFSGRSITAPVGPRNESPQHHIEDVPVAQARQVEEQWAAEDLVVARRDSAMSMGGSSVHSQKSSRHSSHRDSSKTRSSRHHHRSERSSRHSGVSSQRSPRDSSRSTHRSHRHNEASPSRDSQTSTIKPGRAYSAAEIPLPGSRKTSVVSARDIELPASRKTSVASAAARATELPPSRKTSLVSGCDSHLPRPSSSPSSRTPSMTSIAKIPLPDSRAGSLVGSILSRSHRCFSPREDDEVLSAARVALPSSVVRVGSHISPPDDTVAASRRGRDYENDDEDEFIRLPDAETVLPDDSISCVGGRRSDNGDGDGDGDGARRSERSSRTSCRERSRESKRSRHSRAHREGGGDGGRRSEAGSASTVRPAKTTDGKREGREDKGKKGSVASLPVRMRSERDEAVVSGRKRSAVSAAVFGR